MVLMMMMMMMMMIAADLTSDFIMMTYILPSICLSFLNELGEEVYMQLASVPFRVHVLYV